MNIAIGIIAGGGLLLLLWYSGGHPARWLFLFLAAVLLLPPLPLPLGDSGPHAALLFAALGGAVGIARRREWRLRRTLLNTAMVCYLIALAASLIPALVVSGPRLAALSLVRIGLFAISLYVFLYLTQGPLRAKTGDEPAWIRFAAACVFIAALVAVLDFAFQFPPLTRYAYQVLRVDAGLVRRAQGFFYDASALGNLSAFFVLMPAALAVCRARIEGFPFQRWMLAAGTVAVALALLLSYSRGSLVNLLAALAALGLLHRDRIRWRLVIPAALVLGTLAGIASYTLLGDFGWAYWGRLAETVRGALAGRGHVLSGRLDTWSYLLEVLRDRPWLLAFGLGYKTLPYTPYLPRPAVADNMFLGMTLEAGLLGLAALLLLLFAILRESKRAARRPEPLTAFLGTWSFCFWVGQLFQMLTADLLTYWRVLPVYMLVLALAVRSRPSVSHNEPAVS